MEEACFQVRLAVHIWNIEKVEKIAVLENFGGIVRQNSPLLRASVSITSFVRRQTFGSGVGVRDATNDHESRKGGKTPFLPQTCIATAEADAWTRIILATALRVLEAADRFHKIVSCAKDLEARSPLAPAPGQLAVARQLNRRFRGYMFQHFSTIQRQSHSS